MVSLNFEGLIVTNSHGDLPLNVACIACNMDLLICNCFVWFFTFQIKIASKSVRQGTIEEGRDANEKEVRTDMKEMEMIAEEQFATAQEIEKGKMPPEEILSLPMFKVQDMHMLG
jgi:hypothetical protein